MKKYLSLALALCMGISVLSTNAFAATSENGYEFIGTYNFDIPVNGVQTYSETPTVTVTVYNDNGKNIYRMDTTASTEEEELMAFEIFDHFVEHGAVEETVTVDEFHEEFYGSDSDRASSTSSSTGYNAYTYSWGKYLAGDVGSGGEDSCWGLQTARWLKTNTDADYIKLHQSSRINVNNADASLSISWPPALEISSNNSSASVATWSSEPEDDVKSLAADHETVSYNHEDLQYGNVTSFIMTDSADIKYGSTIYKPSTTIRFENGF